MSTLLSRSARAVLLRVALYLLALLVIAMFSRDALEHYFIYFPDPHHEGTPEDIGLPYEEISFHAADRTSLTGWLIPASQNAPVVLFCMGNAGNISHRLDTINLLHNLGVAVFIFNYRGYGTSSGKANEPGLYSDISGAMAFLNERGWPADRTIIFGRSLGAAIGLEAALQTPPAGLIMEAAFTSIPEMGKRHYALINSLLGWLVKAKFDNLSKVKKLNSPLLLIHGSRDTICPPEMSRELSKAGPQDTTLLEISGADHNNAMFVGGSRYRSALADFILQTTR